MECYLTTKEPLNLISISMRWIPSKYLARTRYVYYKDTYTVTVATEQSVEATCTEWLVLSSLLSSTAIAGR